MPATSLAAPAATPTERPTVAPTAAPRPSGSTAGTYVIGGQGATGAFWLVLVDCAQQPHSWRDAVAYCDMPNVRALNVDQATYAAYNQGDPYP